MPVDMVGVLVRRRRVGVVHPVHAIGAAERDDLARAMAGQFVAAPAVGQTQVEGLAALSPARSAAARDAFVSALSDPTSSSLPQIQPHPLPFFHPRMGVVLG